MGNRGAIAAGDVQWMTAGSGIIHQEMPKGDPAGRMHGFQLWANLPVVAQDDRAALSGSEGARHSGDHRRRRHACRVVCGSFWGKKGPVDGIAADPIYLDVSVPPGRRKTLPVETTRHAFAYVFAGSGQVLQCLRSAGRAHRRRRMAGHNASRRKPTIARWCCSTAATKSRCRPARTASASCWFPGKPLEEPVAWYGPIVMNTQEQLQQAFEELEQGNF